MVNLLDFFMIVLDLSAYKEISAQARLRKSFKNLKTQINI